MQQNPLERYTILRELGRGAIGAVYTARDASTGAAVALKILDPALLSQPDTNLAELFLENARSAARLRHRNIVQVLDAGEAGGTAYVAMELLEGESLRRLLDQAPLSTARAIRIFDDIASALAYAHEEGMVHRGFKPSNVIVLRSGAAKIGDFGLGQIGEAALRYKSPEQVRGDPVDHRSDIFSLGAVFYEMLTRRAPFEGTSAKEISASILEATPPRPSELNPHVPGAVDGIVLRMLARNPDERFANVRILLRELQRLEEGLGLGPGAGAGERPVTHEIGQPETKREPTLHAPDVLEFKAFDEHDAKFVMDRQYHREPPSGSRAPIVAALAGLLVVLSIGVFYYSPDVLYYLTGLLEPRTPANRMQEGPLTAAAPSESPVPLPVAAVTHEPVAAPPLPTREVERAATPSTAAAQEATAAAPAPSPAPLPVAPPQTERLPAQEAPPAVQPTASKPEPPPGATAKLIIAVSPLGELFIDGKHYGATPPLTTLDLEPGMHRIEIRSGSRKPYLTYMTVQAGEQRRIRHDFDAKPIRPPT